MKKKYALSFAFFVLFLAALSAQAPHYSTDPHQSAVTTLLSLPDGSTFFSAGRDGFVTWWQEDGGGAHFQATDLEIRLMALHPNDTEVALYETDGLARHRVSVWDWKNLEQKYVKTYAGSVTALSYTKKGSYLAVGTATADQTVFLNPADGKEQQVLKEKTGLVSFIESSDTEASCVMYAPAGTLLYYDLKTGQEKARFATESNLTQGLLFANNLFFAGARGSEIVIVQATTGRVVSRISAANPALCPPAASGEDSFCYVETSGATVTVKRIRAALSTSVSSAETLRQVSRAGRERLTAAFSRQDAVFLGTEEGAVFAVDLGGEAASARPVTKPQYQRFTDIASDDGGLYALTENGVYRAGADAILVAENQEKHTNLAVYGSAIILWSRDTRKSVTLIRPGGERQTIFSPAGTLNSVECFGEKLLILEGHAMVHQYHLETGELTLLYSGSGIQDALFYSGEDLLIAQAASGSPPSSLISVSAATGETVRLSLTADVAFSLTAAENGPVYGIRIDSKNRNRTTVFSFLPPNGAFATVLQTPEEDTWGSTAFYDGVLYTNMGSAEIIAYDAISRKQLTLQRAAALPQKLVKAGEMLAVLTNDGGVSWYEPGKGEILNDWYVPITQ